MSRKTRPARTARPTETVGRLQRSPSWLAGSLNQLFRFGAGEADVERSLTGGRLTSCVVGVGDTVGGRFAVSGFVARLLTFLAGKGFGGCHPSPGPERARSQVADTARDNGHQRLWVTDNPHALAFDLAVGFIQVDPVCTAPGTGLRMPLDLT